LNSSSHLNILVSSPGSATCAVLLLPNTDTTLFPVVTCQYTLPLLPVTFSILEKPPSMRGRYRVTVLPFSVLLYFIQLPALSCSSTGTRSSAPAITNTSDSSASLYCGSCLSVFLTMAAGAALQPRPNSLLPLPEL